MDNLDRPVPGDHGAHGPFDARARATSVQMWLNRNRRWLGAAALVLASAGGFVATRSRRRIRERRL